MLDDGSRVESAIRVSEESTLVIYRAKEGGLGLTEVVGDPPRAANSIDEIACDPRDELDSEYRCASKLMGYDLGHDLIAFVLSL